MPIFEYKCDDCGGISEFLTGVSSEETEIKCADCGGTNLSRKISLSNFAVKTACTRAEAPPCGASAGGTCGHCQFND